MEQAFTACSFFIRIIMDKFYFICIISQLSIYILLILAFKDFTVLKHNIDFEINRLEREYAKYILEKEE